MSLTEPAPTGAPRLKREALRFEFVGLGTFAEVTPSGPDRLYLDVGNGLRPGIIDHHHLAAFPGSTVSLVVTHPDLVLDSVPFPHDGATPFPIVLHAEPDLDCVVSAYLVSELLTTGRLPAAADALARYVDGVDSGHVGLSQEHPFGLYTAYMLLVHRLALRTWRTAEDRWRASVEQALPIVEYVAATLTNEGRSISEIDAFDCPGQFGPHDRAEIRNDRERYEMKLIQADTHARPVRLRLPGQFGGTTEIDALMVRDVQTLDDPERVLFFKDWARSDRARAPERAGFVGLSVFMRHGMQGKPRCIISVRPDAGVCLRGLGTLLDQAEAARRRQSPDEDAAVDEQPPRSPRPGYTIPDPWYDGRSHADTIVDAPTSGTVLPADEIERILLQYGGRSPSEALPPELSAHTAESSATDDASLRRLASLVGTWQEMHGRSQGDKNVDIFISYPHARTAWVESQLHAHLTSWFPSLRVFLDTHSLEGGVGWLAHLAEVVDRCRVFLPVYCEEYFRSDFCQWELQLALARDPVGRKRIVIPVQIEKTTRPRYCAMIQAEDATRADFFDRLYHVLGGIFTGLVGGSPDGEQQTELVG